MIMATRIYQYGGYTYVNCSHVEYSGEISESGSRKIILCEIKVQDGTVIHGMLITV